MVLRADFYCWYEYNYDIYIDEYAIAFYGCMSGITMAPPVFYDCSLYEFYVVAIRELLDGNDW